jgi:choice-of-anchor A domain-containing protein
MTKHRKTRNESWFSGLPVAISLVCSIALTSNAAAVPLLGEASNFAVLGLEGGSVIINSATSITGDVGYGINVTSKTNQKVDSFDGTAYVHSTATFNYTPATFTPTGGIITGGAADALLEQATADALAASTKLAAYTPTVTLGALGDNDSLVLNSTGDMNIFSLTSLDYKEDVLELVGRTGFDDYFVFNIDGSFDFSNSEIKLTGVSADHVIFNFLNASNIKVNKAGTSFAGTILAPLGSVDYHNPASFTGSIIAQNINLHSDFNITNPPQTVPEPSTLLLLMAGLVGLSLVKRRWA